MWNRYRVVFGLLGLTLCLAERSLAQDAPPQSEQKAARESITVRNLKGHIRFLADDLLEGRAPGSRGDELAQKYIATHLERWGYQPAAPSGGWFQPVPLIGVTTEVPQTITLRKDDTALELNNLQDYVFTSGKPVANPGFDDAELVFVGYGMVAPEYQWDDFKGMDLRGKVLVMMNNDPSDDPELFGGKRRLYYGRWDYKYAMAAKQGAAGAIIIHTTPSAGYPYQVVQTSWTGEEFELRDQAGPRLELEGWFSEEAARRVTEFAGLELDQLRQAAEQRDFRPVPLGTTLSLRMRCKVREKDTANVVGILPGRDPQLSREAVILMAHHDHIGLAETRNAEGDNIYNGAVDNASGVAAMLTIAEACSRLPQRPARSILVASVGAEEQGLLGSLYFANKPPRPAGYLAAVINIDGINTLGKTHDINVIGLGKSSLDLHVSGIAQWQKRIVTPDLFPDRGYYYRSDQFSLAKVGVPGVYLHSGVQVVGQPAGWGKAQLEKWVETRYHQPSDEFDETWDLRGAVLDTRLLFYVSQRTANDPNFPTWTPGDEFEAARQAALQARSQPDE